MTSPKKSLINSQRSYFALILTGVFLMMRLKQNGKTGSSRKTWVAITGKLGGHSRAMIFMKGGNAVDAACAMLVCGLYHA
jgi:gamma-glutamyltranspeptidase/glutathione hydrolase